MKKIFIPGAIFLATMVSNPGFAQSKYTDSLGMVLAKAKDETSRVLVLADLGYFHRYQKLDTAMAFCQKAILLAQKIKFSRGESKAYQISGVSYKLRGDLAKSLALMFKSLKIAEENNYQEEIAYSQMRIAIVYFDLNEYQKSINAINKSLRIFGPEKQIRINAINCLQLGNVYETLNQLDSAWRYEKMAYYNLDLIKDLTADVCRAMGMIQLRKGNIPLALKFYRESINSAELQKDFRAISLAYAEIAKLYKSENYLDSSVYYAKNGLAFAQRSSNKRGILTCGSLLAEIFESSNPPEALRYYKIATEVKLIATDINENSEKINHHGKRAGNIVKGMLQHSRSSSGVKEPTDINALCDEYLRLAYHGLRAKDKEFNATMVTNFDETIGNINIIPQDIGRVILNLINNAFYAVSEKQKYPHPLKGGEEYEPVVTLTTRRIGSPSEFAPTGRGDGGKVLISVKDNGNGIPQKILDKIFQPFFTTKPTGQGTGLGLSLSYDIVKAHGGELKVETRDGEGATFTMQFPN